VPLLRCCLCCARHLQSYLLLPDFIKHACCCYPCCRRRSCCRCCCCLCCCCIISYYSCPCWWLCPCFLS
jgi:hypothetical protein